jgi:hypothetical protein
MPEQRHIVNDCRKDFMINHNGSDLHHPGIEPESANSKAKALHIELTGWLKLKE